MKSNWIKILGKFHPPKRSITEIGRYLPNLSIYIGTISVAGKQVCGSHEYGKRLPRLWMFATPPSLSSTQAD